MISVSKAKCPLRWCQHLIDALRTHALSVDMEARSSLASSRLASGARASALSHPLYAWLRGKALERFQVVGPTGGQSYAFTPTKYKRRTACMLPVESHHQAQRTTPSPSANRELFLCWHAAWASPASLSTSSLALRHAHSCGYVRAVSSYNAAPSESINPYTASDARIYSFNGCIICR
jgi:hypothetical protein